MNLNALEVLKELVRLKDYKDKYGKDEHYEVEQPLTWEKARYVLSKNKQRYTTYEDALGYINRMGLHFDHIEYMTEQGIIDMANDIWRKHNK